LLEGNLRMNKQLILIIDDELLIFDTMSKDLADEWPAPVKMVDKEIILACPKVRNFSYNMLAK